jgi:hypothetical protein
MFRLSLTAFAAAAILATAAFSPASAGHFGGRSGGHGGHPGHYRGGYWAHVHHHHPHHHHWGHWGHWREHNWGVPGYGVYSSPVAVSSCPANCLTKDYLPDGRPVFTDQCTKESAIAQPQG